MRAAPRLPDDEVNVSQRHPLGEATLLVLGVSLVTAAIFSLLAWSTAWAARLVPIEVEVELLSEVLEHSPWQLDDSAGSESGRLTRLAARLARHWPDDPYQHPVRRIHDEQPNALALPGGMILVTSGLLDGVTSENELAFVLGHELGHFRNRDHLETLGRGLLFRLLLAGLGLGELPASGLIEISGELTARAYSRDQERDADHFALQLLAAEYGHVAGATSSLSRLGHGGLLEVFEGLAGTHPSSSERIAEILSQARKDALPLQGELRPWRR